MNFDHNKSTLPFSNAYTLLWIIAALVTGAACDVSNNRAHSNSFSATASTIHPSLEVSDLKQLTRFEYVQLLNRNHWLVADHDGVWKTDDGGRT